MTVETGCASWVGCASDIAQIVGLLLAIIAVVWGYRQLRAAIASAQSQSVLALDQAFAQFEPLRRALNASVPADPKLDDDISLRRYVAVFERLGLLLKTGVVNEGLANQLYGSRLETLLEKAEKGVRKIVREREGRGWENFIYLWKRMRTVAPDRKLPDVG